MEIVVSSFYKYAKIEDPVEFQKEHQKYCDFLGIKGKVLVGKEGINGTVSGFLEQIERYEDKVKQLFKDIHFKRTISEQPPFKKTIVRVRKEIVSSGLKVNLKNTAKYISPKELKELLDKKEEVIILDARNNYESKIGKFKNAITPDIEVFREFPKVVEDIKDLKNKKIVTYCTGGIRCEKASAYLKENGFNNVFQIEGGILNFIEQFPNTYFEGRCFVFDDRISIPTGSKIDLTICELCHVSCSRYINCQNAKCNKFFICCEECSEPLKETCSKTCRGIIESKKPVKEIHMQSKRFSHKFESTVA